MQNGNLNMSGDKTLPHTDTSMPHIIVEDEGLPLNKHLSILTTELKQKVMKQKKQKNLQLSPELSMKSTRK
jgi:hypothetical protein